VIAAKAGVSEHQVRQAEDVAANAPHLIEKVAHGELQLKDAVGHKERKAMLQPYSAVRAFDEQAVLVRLVHEWEEGVNRHWPENRDLAPVIRKLQAFAKHLERLQKVSAAQLQKKIEAIR
jgi:hypothetical protein